MRELPEELESELDLPRRIRLAGNGSERARGNSGIRAAEDGMIHGVEELGAKLASNFLGELELLEDGKVPVADGVGPDIGQVAGEIAECESGSLAVSCRIEIGGQAILNPPGLRAAAPVAVWLGAGGE